MNDTKPHMVQTCKTPRFDGITKEALTFLEDQGYAVIRGVMTKEEVAKGISLAW